MKLYEFGDLNKPVIILLPGTCCHWKANFEKVIPFLAEDFRVVCVSYDGFDETEKTVFSDMLTETEKIENYIKENCGEKTHAAYGCSMGGSFVGLLVQRKNVHISHAILGSSDLDQEDGFSAKCKAWLIGKILYGMFPKGRLPGFMKRQLEKKPADERLYYDKMLDMFGMNNTRMSFVERESIRNQFFYAVKMGEKYQERYHMHFKNPDIRRHDMQHEELLICYPKRWAEEVRKCCEISQ